MKILTETLPKTGISFKMIAVEGSTFTMGCTEEQSYCDDDEKPSHRVTLSNYNIGETEVTQKLWRAVMGKNPSCFKGEKRPVEQVSWENTQVFMEKLKEMTGKNYRLPTEAEWEYAARAGENYTYAGSDNLHEVGWCSDNSDQKTKPVGLKKPNAWGLFDMSGNVFEWCQDRYGDYLCSNQRSPVGPDGGCFRVLRGGSWFGYPDWCRVTYRTGYMAAYSYMNTGFRIALSEQS